MPNIFKDAGLLSYRQVYGSTDIEDLDSKQVASVIADLLYMFQLDLQAIVETCHGLEPKKYVYEHDYHIRFALIQRMLTLFRKLSVNENEEVYEKVNEYWKTVYSNLGTISSLDDLREDKEEG